MVVEKEWIRPPLLDAWYLSGPTASGKTEVGVRLAKKLNAEIISLDSMAVYRGMDIGTAKPSLDHRAQVVHHLIDIVDPTDAYSVSQFVMDAHRVASEIRSRGHEVLFVGGTPLYLKTLLRGMFLGPEADWEFRKSVEQDVSDFGIESLHQRLKQVDPLSAHKILPGDLRRMTRALEVAKVTGRPLSHWQSQFENAVPKDECRVFVLGWDRAQLHARVNARVESMFLNGLVDEVKGLLDRFENLGQTAAQAVGYKEVIEFLNGVIDREEAIRQVQAHTRQFVRRQEIWFRSLTENRRQTVTDETDLDSLVDSILEQGSFDL